LYESFLRRRQREAEARPSSGVHSDQIRPTWGSIPFLTSAKPIPVPDLALPPLEHPKYRLRILLLETDSLPAIEGIRLPSLAGWSLRAQKHGI
jgi:hypothetical protein